jgi:hypothetical protein
MTRKANEIQDAAPVALLPAKYEGRLGLSVEEFCELVPVSPWATYADIKRGNIPCITVGRRKIIPILWIKNQLAGAR